MRETLPESRNWSKPMPWEIPLHNKQPQGRSRLLRPSDCRKTYITKRVVRLTPINPQKAATCAWLFALLKGQVCAKGVHTAPCKNSKKWPKPLFRHAQHRKKHLAVFFSCFQQAFLTTGSAHNPLISPWRNDKTYRRIQFLKNLSIFI